MAGAITASVLTAAGSGYSATSPFNEGYVVQDTNVSARYRVDTLDAGPNGVATYTIIDPGSDYVTGGALTSADFGGSGFELEITAVSGSGPTSGNRSWFR